MSFSDEKNRDATYPTSHTSARQSNGPLSTTLQNNKGMSSIANFEKQDLKYKRNIRTLRFTSRFISLILNVIMIGTLSYGLAKYYTTRNLVISGNAHPWVTPTTLWPTYMLLAIAIVTFLMNSITICAYICGVGAANKAGSMASYVSIFLLVVRAIFWGVATGLFRMAKTGRDIWGYTCSSQSDAIQDQVKGFLNFGTLCTTQKSAWGASIIETISYLLTIVTLLLIMRRASQKKKMEKMRLGGYAPVG